MYPFGCKRKMASQWEEAKHPREGGKFAPKEGGSTEGDTDEDLYKRGKAMDLDLPVPDEEEVDLEGLTRSQRRDVLGTRADERSARKEATKYAKRAIKDVLRTGGAEKKQQGEIAKIMKTLEKDLVEARETTNRQIRKIKKEG